METFTENQNWSKLTLGAQALLIDLKHIHKPEDREHRTRKGGKVARGSENHETDREVVALKHQQCECLNKT